MDYLIVGGGLAGLSLAWRMKERGLQFKLIENRDQPSSTAAATGMYNPIVFRRLNLSWMIDELLPEMHAFYSSVENRLEITINQPISYNKHIPNDQYEALWLTHRKLPLYTGYLGPIENGYGAVLQAGMIDCPKFKDVVLESLQESGHLVNELFSFSELSVNKKSTQYKGHTYDKIIFCEGPYAVNNPYFNWLPFKLCRGEWIDIQTEQPVTSEVINNRVNIIPMGGNRYRISSTYHWDNLDWKPTTSAREELLDGFKTVFDVAFQVVDQKAGIRPTVADRRPYLGQHPAHPPLYIFNGLGSKGVMLAPYFSNHLLDYLESGAPLLDEVNINRHIKRFQNR